MTNISAPVKPSRVKNLYLALREHLSIPLFANAYALITNQVIAAGLGILYWTIAARLYPVDVVGENSALISTIIFLSMLSELSLKGAMTRFIPRAGKDTSRIVLYTYLANIAIGLLVGIFMLTVGPHINIFASLLNGVGLSPIWLILFSVLWTIFYVQDGILIGMRKAKWVLIKNVALSVTKIVLLVVFLRSSSNYGMVNSWFMPVPIFIVVFGLMISWRFMPIHMKQDVSHTKPVTRDEVLKSTAGDHVGSILAEASIRMLPLVVLYFLGKEATAYFNQAWIIASTFQAISTNMASSFIVEASANMKQISMNSRRILRQMFMLIVPAVVFMWFGAPFVLYIFGRNYSEQSFVVLRWLVVATIPYMFIAWYLGYVRVLSKVWEIILIQGSQLVLTLGAGYFLLPRLGITGIGLSWLAGQTLVALGIFVRAIPILWPKASAGDNSLRTKNQVLRRVDWRFLLTKAHFDKSILLTPNDQMHASLAEVSTELLDMRSALPQDCDVAVAIHPGQETLQAANKALRAEGVLYSEWAAWRAGGVKGIRSKLERAGFENIRFYWPFPDSIEPKFWLPLPSPRAVFQYLLRTRLTGEQRPVVSLRSVLATLLGFVARMGALPYLGVVADRGPLASRNVFDAIRTQHARSYPTHSSDELSFLVRSSGTQISSKIVILVFNDLNGVSPSTVIKIPRLSEDKPTLEQEKSILTALRPLVQSDRLPFSIPEFLFDESSNSVDFFAQTALSGRSFGSVLKSTSFAEAASRLTQMQIALAKQTLGSRSNGSTSQQYVEHLMGEWSRLKNGEVDEADVHRIQRIVSSLPPLPAVYAHNDFTPWNIVEIENTTGLFDWSDATQNGLPLLDLVYGLANAAFVMENANIPKDMQNVYQKLIDPSDSLGNVFQNCLEVYARAMDLPAGSIGPLRLLTWVRHSVYEFENHRLESDEDEMLLTTVCIPLIKLELRVQKYSSVDG